MVIDDKNEKPKQCIERVNKSYLSDHKEDKNELIEWFLNSVMDEEALEQIHANSYTHSLLSFL